MNDWIVLVFERFCGPQGRPSMFVDFRVVDDAGQVLPHDGRAQGELQVRGLHVVREYFRVRRPSGIHQPSAIIIAHTILVTFFIVRLP